MFDLLLSVIIPIYKVEPYLRKCIDSLANQTVRCHEIILVDDGSPDGCPEICDEYAARYDFVRIIHKTNGGVSSARNAGLEIATGKYIWFVDADDYVEFDAIEKLSQQINAESDLLVFDRTIEASGTIVDPNLFFNDVYFRYLLGFESWNKWYKRSIIHKALLRFDSEETVGEDLLFNAVYYTLIHNYQIIKSALYHYEDRSGSAMHTNLRDRPFQQMRLYDKLISCWKSRLNEENKCVLFIMHLLSGLNQSCGQLSRREYTFFLQTAFQQHPYSPSILYKATQKLLSNEQASFAGKIRAHLMIQVNAHGIHIKI